MGNDKPAAEQYRDLAKIVQEKISGTERKTEIMMETLSQLFLLLGTNMSGSGRLAVDALHKEFLGECRPLRMSWQTTFHDVFSGNGPLANYLREKVDFSQIATLYPEIESAQEARNIVLRDIESFDFKLHEDPNDYKALLAFLHDLQEGSANMMPFSFVHCPDPRGLEIALSEMAWDQAWGTFPSGFYEDTSRPAKEDGSIPWIFLMKVNVFSPGVDACRLVLLMRQQCSPQIYINHPFEGGWYPWDQKHMLRNMLSSLVREYAMHALVLLRPRAVRWNFQEEIKGLVDRNRKYLWQHGCLPSQLVFGRKADPAPGVFADFMWVPNSARLTVLCVNVCMVFYCTYHNNNWDQQVRFIRPQHPKSLITIPIDEKDISEDQQRALIQRASYAINLKNRAIEEHHQKEREAA